MRFSLLDAPMGDVVSLAEARAHLRVDDEDQDQRIASCLAAATACLDGRDGTLNQALLTQTWQAFLPDPRHIPQPRAPLWRDDKVLRVRFGPLIAVTELACAIGDDYIALDPALYRVRRITKGLFEIRQARNATWPLPDEPCDPDAWRVTFSAGFGLGADVPAPIRSAILLMVSDLFENRDGKVSANLVANPTVAHLLAPYSFAAMG